MRRPIVIGAVVGALLGTAFALAVVSFADCSGSRCARERAEGVLLHALAGTVLGAVAGLATALVTRALRRRR